MRIAVISDIHGNMDALESVLESIRKERCEKIFVLGDIAMAGPQPEDTIDWFMQNAENYNITMIQGNTDLMIANYSAELYKTLAEKAPVIKKNNASEKIISPAFPPMRDTAMYTLDNNEYNNNGVNRTIYLLVRLNTCFI